MLGWVWISIEKNLFGENCLCRVAGRGSLSLWRAEQPPAAWNTSSIIPLNTRVCLGTASLSIPAQPRLICFDNAMSNAPSKHRSGEFLRFSAQTKSKSFKDLLLERALFDWPWKTKISQRSFASPWAVAELEGGGNWERSVEWSGIGGKKVEEIAPRHQPATCNLPSSSIASIDQPSQSAAQHRCRFDACFFLSWKSPSINMNTTGCPIPNKLLTEFWGLCWATRFLGQCWPKMSKLAKTVQDDLDCPRCQGGPKIYSPNMVLKILWAIVWTHCSKNTGKVKMDATKNILRIWCVWSTYDVGSDSVHNAVPTC